MSRPFRPQRTSSRGKPPPATHLPATAAHPKGQQPVPASPKNRPGPTSSPPQDTHTATAAAAPDHTTPCTVDIEITVTDVSTVTAADPESPAVREALLAPRGPRSRLLLVPLTTGPIPGGECPKHPLSGGAF